MKVFVGMSGGVDSSVAALLLKNQGYDVTGVFMKCYNLDGCAERDAEDARRVAGELDIPFYVFDFEKEYKKKVVEYMIKGYRAGLTPNPDVMCNREIKFGLFMKKARALGADYIATGHYVKLGRITFRNQHDFLPARKSAFRSLRNSPLRAESKLTKLRDISQGNPTPLFLLGEAKDKNKDQSYFLWTLTQNELKHSLFPLGNLTKPEVRAIAKKAGLATAEKKDSQGICFLGMVDVMDFLKRYIKPRKGDVVTTEGEVIGTHEGATFYTIGQRHIGVNFQFSPTSSRVLGIAGTISNSQKKKDRKPYYVAAKDVKKNIVVVAEGNDNSALAKKEVTLTDVNFVSPSQKCHTLSVLARVRYRQPLSPAKLMKVSDKKYKLVFSKPQKFVAEGQSAVFYSKSGELVGGGIIV